MIGAFILTDNWPKGFNSARDRHYYVEYNEGQAQDLSKYLLPLHRCQHGLFYNPHPGVLRTKGCVSLVIINYEDCLVKAP